MGKWIMVCTHKSGLASMFARCHTLGLTKKFSCINHAYKLSLTKCRLPGVRSVTYQVSLTKFHLPTALTQGSLTKWVDSAVFVRDGEDTSDGVSVTPQLLVHVRRELTLANDCDAHALPSRLATSQTDCSQTQEKEKGG